MKRRLFTCLALVTLTTIVFLSMKSNPKATPASMACTDAAMDSCNQKAVALKLSCEVRNEGIGTGFLSCRCQSIRAAEKCYRDTGCAAGAGLFRSVSPECFIPLPTDGDACWLEFDGGFTNSCECNPEDPTCTSPILVDVAGNGYDLTGVPDGVAFDIRGDGRKRQTAWTWADSDDAWLYLDRDGNGVVDDVTELFGDLTAQPEGAKKNGFLALAEFDKRINSFNLPGNEDQIISSEDAVFKDLKLWQDKNHNGISEPIELHSLPSLKVYNLSLDYHERRRRDKHGNFYRYFTKEACDVYVIHER